MDDRLTLGIYPDARMRDSRERALSAGIRPPPEDASSLSLWLTRSPTSGQNRGFLEARGVVDRSGMSEMSPVNNELTVLVVDHNPIFLSGVIALIQSQGRLALVGSATNDEEAMALFLRHTPRIILMDLDLPDSSALKTIRGMKQLSADVAIIGMATYEFDRIGNLALANGADGVISKERFAEDLLRVVRLVTERFPKSDRSDESN